MSSGHTPRLGIAYPIGSDPDAFPTDIEAIATYCDNNFIPYVQQATAPVSPATGTFWWCTDTTSTQYGMNYYTGTAWRSVSLGNVYEGSSTPSTVFPGLMWIDTTNPNKAFKIYNGSAWDVVIPTTTTYGLALVSSASGLVYAVPTDTTKVAKAGDTMTGLLILSGDPAAALGAATKQYVDAETTRAEAAEATLIPKANNNAELTAPLEASWINATAPNGVMNLYVSTNPTSVLCTSNATANFSFNVASSSVTALNSLLAAGEEISIAVKVKQGTTAYYCTAISIDSVAQTVNWQGGSAPTYGYVSGYDVYTINITKTAANTYVVLAALVQF